MRWSPCGVRGAAGGVTKPQQRTPPSTNQPLYGPWAGVRPVPLAGGRLGRQPLSLDLVFRQTTCVRTLPPPFPRTQGQKIISQAIKKVEVGRREGSSTPSCRSRCWTARGSRCTTRDSGDGGGRLSWPREERCSSRCRSLRRLEGRRCRLRQRLVVEKRLGRLQPSGRLRGRCQRRRERSARPSSGGGGGRRGRPAALSRLRCGSGMRDEAGHV